MCMREGFNTKEQRYYDTLDTKRRKLKTLKLKDGH